MAEKIVLEASKREVIGKQVRHLRRQGIVPGVIYGPGIESQQVQIPWTVLRPTLRRAGGSSVIELKVDDETYNVLVRDVQRSPLLGEVVHIDFYRVRMDVAIRTEVPIVTTGTDRHITERSASVSQEMNSIEVECLPTVLPSEIQVDLSLLKQVGDSITVGDLPQFEGVIYHADPEVTVVSSAYLSLPDEEEEEEEESEFAGSSEPELIRRQEDEDFEE